MPFSTSNNLRSKATSNSRTLGNSGFDPGKISGRSKPSFGTGANNAPATTRSSNSGSSWWSKLTAPFSSKSTNSYGGMGSAAPGRTIKSQMKQTEGW